MKYDLISREALKKALHNFFDGKVIDEPAYILRDVFCYIESAPTVDTTEQEENAYNEGYAHGLETKIPQSGQVVPDMLQGWRYEERPQGRWIHSAAKKYYAICSLCSYESIIWNADFCPGCGARMQKDENKEE